MFCSLPQSVFWSPQAFIRLPRLQSGYDPPRPHVHSQAVRTPSFLPLTPGRTAKLHNGDTSHWGSFENLNSHLYKGRGRKWGQDRGGRREKGRKKRQGKEGTGREEWERQRRKGKRERGRREGTAGRQGEGEQRERGKEKKKPSYV